MNVDDKGIVLPALGGKDIALSSGSGVVDEKVVILNSRRKQICIPVTTPIVGDIIAITPTLGGKQIGIKAGAAVSATGIVLAGRYNWPDGGKCEIFRSIDYATTFTAVANFNNSGSIMQFAFNGTMMLAAIGSGVYGECGIIARSTNSGLTWTNVYNGVFPYNSDGMGGVAFGEGGIAIATGTAYDQTVCEIYRSTDNGATWTSVLEVESGITGNVCYFGRGIFVVGVSTKVYRSIDNGLTWSLVLSAGGAGYDTIGTEILYLGSGDALLVRTWTDDPYPPRYCQMYKTTDYGLTWTLKSSETAWRMGLTKASDGRVLFVYYDGGIYQSFDKGDTWTQWLAAPYPDLHWLMEVQRDVFIVVKHVPGFYHGMHRIVSGVPEDIHNVILPDGVYRTIWRVQAPP